MSTLTPLKVWMQAATADEQVLLATAVGTSRSYLYQLAGAHRECGAQLASAIEAETERMHKASKGRLPRVYRSDLSPVCRNCEFARRCLGDAVVVRGHFEPVTTEDMKP